MNRRVTDTVMELEGRGSFYLDLTNGHLHDDDSDLEFLTFAHGLFLHYAIPDGTTCEVDGIELRRKHLQRLGEIPDEVA